MTAAAKRDEILSAVVTALGQWLDMMHLFRFHQQTFFETQLTEWMLLNIFVTDTLPSTTVATLGFRIPVVLLVALVFSLLVFRTEASFRKVGAAGERTGTLGLAWHSVLLLWAIEKPPQIISTMALFIFAFRYYNDIIRGCCIAMDVTVHLPGRPRMPELFYEA